MAHKDREAHLQYRRAYTKRNRAKLRPYQRERNRAKARRLLEFMHTYKEGKPCADCGNTYHPVCMDLDHVNGEKKLPVSRAKSWASLLPELEKCELVCANCHRLRTYIRGQHGNGKWKCGTSVANAVNTMAATKLEQQQIEEAQLALEVELMETIENRQNMLAVVSELQAQIDAIDEEVKQRMMREGCLKITVNGVPISVTRCKGRSSLDKTKLIELGVLPATIAAATKTGDGYDRFTVGEAKE
jgi:hypothetical protein